MAQTGQRKDPLVSFSFYVDIQGTVVGTFRECTGMGSETELVEAKESDKGKLVYMKIPGALKWENISLKRGIDINPRRIRRGNFREGETWRIVGA